MSFIKDNGGPIVLIGVAAAVIAGYIELRLPSDAELQAKVDAKFVAAGAVPVHRMDSAEDDIEDNKDDIKTLTDRWNNLVDAISKE